MAELKEQKKLNFLNFVFKSHPEKDKLLETCPYNATHRYAADEKIQHLLGI